MAVTIMKNSFLGLVLTLFVTGVVSASESQTSVDECTQLPLAPKLSTVSAKLAHLDWSIERLQNRAIQSSDSEKSLYYEDSILRTGQEKLHQQNILAVIGGLSPAASVVASAEEINSEGRIKAQSRAIELYYLEYLHERTATEYLPSELISEIVGFFTKGMQAEDSPHFGELARIVAAIHGEDYLLSNPNSISAIRLLEQISRTASSVGESDLENTARLINELHDEYRALLLFTSCESVIDSPILGEIARRIAQIHIDFANVQTKRHKFNINNGVILSRTMDYMNTAILAANEIEYPLLASLTYGSNAAFYNLLAEDAFLGITKSSFGEMAARSKRLSDALRL